MAEQLYRWRWRAKLPDRHGDVFRVLARGSMNSCLIEFLSDGHQVVTSRNALRRILQAPVAAAPGKTGADCAKPASGTGAVS